VSCPLQGGFFFRRAMQGLASTTATSVPGCSLAPSVLNSSTSSAPLLALFANPPYRHLPPPSPFPISTIPDSDLPAPTRTGV